MSSSEATFPALFAELVYLLAHEPDAVDEQQKVLGRGRCGHRGMAMRP
jgi:hypothetical protein